MPATSIGMCVYESSSILHYTISMSANHIYRPDRNTVSDLNAAIVCDESERLSEANQSHPINKCERSFLTWSIASFNVAGVRL